MSTDPAIESAVAAAKASPNDPAVWRNLAALLVERGQDDAAIQCLFRVVQIDPNDGMAYRQLGELLLGIRNFDQGVDATRRAVELMPDNLRALFQLAQGLDLQNRVDEAAATYRKVHERAPRDVTRLTLATQLKHVYDSMDDLLRTREKVERGIAELLREGFQLPIDRIPASPMMLLAYHGLNDRDILRDYAKLFAPPPAVTLDPRPPQRARIRVGFISLNLGDHTIGKVNRGLIAQLDRTQFEVFALQIGPATDPFLRQHADRVVNIPTTPLDARPLIAQQQLDILFYTDIGMDSYTYTLAHSRLAPVQCVTWGHPSTTGIPTIDYYVSSELLESDEAEQHYTEKLVKLPNLSVYYYRPAEPQAAFDRRTIGLDDDTHLYGCLQSLFKFHPEFDVLMDGILQQDSKGVIIIPRGNSRYWDEALMRRLTRTMPRTIDRVRLINGRPFEQYLALTAACDVMLAPIHFGAGNTSYEALAYGVPVVTLPSKMLKGRITHALYRAMNMSDCVANSPGEYIDLAVRLGTDKDFRRATRERILATNPALYQNPAGVRDLENFFRSADYTRQ
jgi:predicted O-linked N-acetylglucosamine transferase (SPINDLY family)